MTGTITVPRLLVYREPGNGHLHFKADDVKGARWRNSKSESLDAVSRLAAEFMPVPYEFDFVEEQR